MTRALDWLNRQGEKLFRAARTMTPEIVMPLAPRRAESPRIEIGGLRLPAFANPGALGLHIYVPHNLPAGAPLVVVLHGCNQDAEEFATRSGWRYLASRHNFALLIPEQTEANNAQCCFNWFRPGDIVRGHGEAESIAAMSQAMVAGLHLDRERVFVTGLSAGGAMTAALLAAYPDLFAGGAVVAGLPAGSASNVVNAMARMAGRGPQHDPLDWAGHARRIGPPLYRGRYPKVSVWQGLADPVVAAGNARDVALQFATLHGLNHPSTTVPHRNMHRTVWGDGAPAVELWELDFVGHDYPTEADQGISAAHEIAKFWGLFS
jgi:poly(hydroxyalkanoate) depolymerase family esterase